MNTKQLLILETFCLAVYIFLTLAATFVFVLILPYSEIVANLPNFAKLVLDVAIKNQFVIQTLLATAAACIHGYRTIGI